MDPLTQDIADRLTARLNAVADLFGRDVADAYGERPGEVAPVYASLLTGGDPRVAAQTALDLACLVDLDDPADGASPLGVACALTSNGAVSQATAAAVLGVSRQRVYVLLADGKLDRAGTTDVTRASIARRLAALNRTSRR